MSQTITGTDSNLNRPVWWQPWIGYHSLDRYREHYYGADRNDILWDLVGGVEIPADLAGSMLGRFPGSPKGSSDSTSQDYYILNRERRGIFILACDQGVAAPINPKGGFPSTMVTYIRMSQESVLFALKEWPPSHI